LNIVIFSIQNRLFEFSEFHNTTLYSQPHTNFIILKVYMFFGSLYLPAIAGGLSEPLKINNFRC
jgi:hypothetical protein